METVLIVLVVLFLIGGGVGDIPGGGAKKNTGETREHGAWSHRAERMRED